MKKLKLISSVLCLLLALAMLAPGAYAASAGGGRDMSRPGSLHNKRYTAADIVEYLTGLPLHEAERNYLLRFDGDAIVYNDGITTASIAASFDPELGALSVTAYEFEYTAADGALVVWTPVRATLGDEVIGLEREEGAYTAEFGGLSAEPDVTSVGVTYYLDVEISASLATDLVNRAYLDAPMVAEDLAERMGAYENALYEYGEAVVLYEKYLQDSLKYEQDSAAFAEYVLKKAEYDEALQAYLQYRSDLAEFQAQTEAYEKYKSDLLKYGADYQAWVAAEDEYKKYLVAKSEYDAYRENVRVCVGQLAAIDLAKVKMTPLNRTAYDAINSSLVDTVIARKADITTDAVGVSPDVVDLAGAATERLRILMDDFFALETDDARYNYYSVYYLEFRDNFRNLFVSLDHLYKNGMIRAKAIEEQRDEKYRILVAQLYLISQALTDGPLMSIDPSYVAAGKGSENKNYRQFVYTDDTFRIDVMKYTVTDVLGDTVYIVDRDKATPVAGGFPATVPLPKAPERLTEPTPPAVVEPPMALDYGPVAYPGDAPEAVLNPGDPPEVVREPTEPEEYVPDPTLVDLVDAYYGGELSEREADFGSNPTIRIEKTVNKHFVDAEEVTVYFIGTDGHTVLYVCSVDRDSGVDFLGEEPSLPEDDRAFYTFNGWVTEGGDRPDLSAVSGDLVLYPDFIETIKEYTVSFEVAGAVTEQRLPYGAIPDYGSAPVKPEDGVYYYTFVGWDKPIVSVTADARYTAIFDSDYILPTESGGGRLSFENGAYVADMSSATEKVMGLSGLLERADGKYGVKIKTKNLNVSMTAAAVRGAISAGACQFSFDFTRSGDDLFRYSVRLLDADGALIEGEHRMDVTFYQPNTLEDSRMKLSYDSTDGPKYVKYTLEGDSVSFTATSGRSYVLRREYYVTLAPTDSAQVGVSGSIFTEGSTVSVSVDVPVGIAVKSVFYVDSDGVQTEISGGSFRMPACDVTVFVQTEKITYRITFVSEGVVLRTLYCTYGELPEAPEEPKKANDSEYSYAFVGWSEDVVAVDAAKVYTAVFEATPLPVELEPVVDGGIYDDALKVMLGAGVAIVLAILTAVAVALRRR